MELNFSFYLSGTQESYWVVNKPVTAATYLTYIVQESQLDQTKPNQTKQKTQSKEQCVQCK